MYSDFYNSNGFSTTANHAERVAIVRELARISSRAVRKPTQLVLHDKRAFEPVFDDRSPRERYVSAVHEAAHARTALALNVPVTMATIQTTPDTDGRVEYSARGITPTDHIAIIFAGSYAMAKHMRRDCTDMTRITPSDGQEIRSIMAGNERLMFEGFALGAELVDHKWDSVCAIAMALMERTTLRSNDLLTLL